MNPVSSRGRACRAFSIVLLLFAATLALGQVLAPTIHTVNVEDGDNLRPGVPFVLRFHASAGSLPLVSATFQYANKDGLTRTFSTTSPESGMLTLPVTDDWPSGEFVLRSVALQSGLGTSNFYPPNSGFPWTSVPGAMVSPGPSESLFQTRFVVSGTRTYVRPVLTAVTVTGAPEVTAGGSIAFRIAITPGSSAVTRVALTFNDPNRRIVSTESLTASSLASLTIPTGAMNGRYTLENVAIFDESGRWVAYSRTGGLQASGAPSSTHNVSFTGADFLVTGGVDTVTFPTLQSFTLNRPGVAAGQTLSLDYVVVPGNRPLKTVTFIFMGPIGYVQVVGNGPASSGTASVVVPTSWVSGRYVLDRIELADTVDYRTAYQANDLVSFSPVLGTQVGRHSFRFAEQLVDVSLGIDPVPVITLQPKDATVDPGRSVELRVEAVSPGVGSFGQWFEGPAGDTSKPVIGSTSSITVQPSTTTSYWVRLSNAYGSVDSRAAVVTPRFTSDLPVILYHPGSVSTPVGNYVMLSASVVGPGPLAMAWFKDGIAVPGATNSRIELGALQASGSGTYYLAVTNPHGTVFTNPVQVVAKEQPRIVSQTRSQTARVGERVTFNVEATGGELRYSWGRENASLVGASGTTYTIENVQRGHAGTYGVYISNDLGSLTSEPMVLTVIDPNLPPPEFVNLPEKLYTSVGSAFGFFVYAINDAANYRVSSPLPPGIVWNERERHFLGPITAPGEYRVTFSASNTAGTASRTITIQVFPQQFVPIITKSPQSQQVYVDERVTLSAEVQSAPDGFFDYTRYQWKKDGVALSGRTSPELEFYAVRFGDAGVYTLEVSNSRGTAVSSPATLTVLPVLSPPAITAQPQSQVVKPGATATFSVAAGSVAPLTYQWLRNGKEVIGATAASLRLDAVEAPQSGTYTVKVKNRAGTVTSVPATLTLDEVIPGHLTNLSVRAFTAAGERTLIAGLAVAGPRAKPLLLRVVGPSLQQFGLTLAHADPKMTLMSGSRMIDANDDWGSGMSEAGMSVVDARVGAFALRQHVDAAMQVNLDGGAYSILAGSATPASGIVLIEVYDADESYGRVSSRLVNLSARSQVGTGADVLIAGFAVAGQTPCNVLLRGIGPALADFGVGNALAAPRLRLYRGQTLLAENANWNVQAPGIAAAARAVGAFALRNGSADAAMLTSLAPGTYTVILSGLNNATGAGLIEVYEAP